MTAQALLGTVGATVVRPRGVRGRCSPRRIGRPGRHRARRPGQCRSPVGVVAAGTVVAGHLALVNVSALLGPVNSALPVIPRGHGGGRGP